MYRTLQCSELRLHIKGVSYFQFVVCSQIYPLSGDTISMKLLIMNSAFASFIIQILLIETRTKIDTDSNIAYEQFSIGKEEEGVGLRTGKKDRRLG